VDLQNLQQVVGGVDVGRFFRTTINPCVHLFSYFQFFSFANLDLYLLLYYTKNLFSLKKFIKFYQLLNHPIHPSGRCVAILVC